MKKYIFIRVIDFNNLDIHDEKNISEDEIYLDYLAPYLDSILENTGLKISIDDVKLIDRFTFNKFIIKKLFPNYEIIDRQKESHQQHETGIPDFELTSNNKTIFVEVKSDNDTIKPSQIEWILKAVKQNKKVIIVRIKHDYSYNKKDSISEEIESIW